MEKNGARRVLILPVADQEGASTRYRVLAHLPALEAAGFATEVRFPLTRFRRGASYRLLRALDLTRDICRSGGADILFIHRKTYPPPLALGLRRPHRAVVFDLDDALDLPPPGKDPGERGRRRYRRNFIATLEAADLALCANRALASRLPHDRFEILPTPIDTTRFAPEAVGEATGPVLGWVGYSDNLGYLESLTPHLLEVRRRHPGLRLVVVADRPPRMPGIEVEFRQWSLASEISCFRGICIGLMPLDDTPWARAKS
ncbi:MAG: hypothetical protein HY509_03445, partial [Acidobacteria bacterium]|nr:hypothetical protein [Acidobacteriota bacterium]